MGRRKFCAWPALRKPRISSASSKILPSSSRRRPTMIKTFASRTGLRLLSLALLLTALFAPARPSFAAATVIVVNFDGANEGFNDPTVVAPVGGNTGTTRGQQRLIAFEYAANPWGAQLDSRVPIVINAIFDPLQANILGSTGICVAIRDFPRA